MPARCPRRGADGLRCPAVAAARVLGLVLVPALALADGVAALLDDPAARADLAARARQRAAELPTDEDARDAALDVYREVCPDPV